MPDLCLDVAVRARMVSETQYSPQTEVPGVYISSQKTLENELSWRNSISNDTGRIPRRAERSVVLDTVSSWILIRESVCLEESNIRFPVVTRDL